jgi:hypothetical protein
MTALGRPEAQAPLLATHELFASMGHRPELAGPDALLERTTDAASAGRAAARKLVETRWKPKVASDGERRRTRKGRNPFPGSQ